MAQERELIVWMENQPGSLATIGKVLIKRGVSIRAILAPEQRGRSPLHLLVDKLAEAKDALKDLAVELEERDVLTLELDNHPGALGETVDKLAKEGINIDYAYFSLREGESRDLVVLGVADVSRAEKILG